MARGRLAATGAGLVTLAALVLAPARAQPSPDAFRPEERRALIGGELVRRPMRRDEHGFHYVGGTSWQVVDAPVETVWRVVNDVSTYPEIIPGADRARLVTSRGPRRVVFVHHRFGLIEAGYHAVVQAEEASHTLRFDLDRTRPHDVRAGHGFLTVTPFRSGRSIVTWGVLAAVGSRLVTGLLGPLLQDRILLVPTCVGEVVKTGRSSC